MSDISKTQRVWTKVDKQFLSVRTEFVSNNTIVIYERGGAKALYYVPDSTYLYDNLVIQWGSGINDSKGNEIIEGDIVEVGPDGNTNKSYRGEIILSTKDYFMIKSEHGKIEPLLDSKDIKIIGNIFQLPCKPDHNGECLVCDNWLSDCPFNKNEDDKVIEIMGQKFNQHWAEQLIDVCKTTSVISEEQISLDLPEKYKPEFEEFMRGKTCPILENGQRGVYSWDFEQYLKTVLK